MGMLLHRHFVEAEKAKQPKQTEAKKPPETKKTAPKKSGK